MKQTVRPRCQCVEPSFDHQGRCEEIAYAQFRREDGSVRWLCDQCDFFSDTQLLETTEVEEEA